MFAFSPSEAALPRRSPDNGARSHRASAQRDLCPVLPAPRLRAGESDDASLSGWEFPGWDRRVSLLSLGTFPSPPGAPGLGGRKSPTLQRNPI